MRRTGYKSRCLWLAAAVFWMVLIFYFSDQQAGQSSELSGSLTWRMAEGVNNIFRFAWGEDDIMRYAAAWEHPVRKAAHMTEYAILAWIFLGNCMQYPVLQKKSYLWAGVFTSFYAATDEFHQLFVKGRSGEIRDVMIDSIGAVLGLLFIRGVSVLYKRMKRKR